MPTATWSRASASARQAPLKSSDTEPTPPSNRIIRQLEFPSATASNSAAPASNDSESHASGLGRENRTSVFEAPVA